MEHCIYRAPNTLVEEALGAEAAPAEAPAAASAAPVAENTDPGTAGYARPSYEEDRKALATLRLSCGSGPLRVISSVKTTTDAWEALKDTYSPEGYSTQQVYISEFLAISPEKYADMEQFVERVRFLTAKLPEFAIKIPEPVTIELIRSRLPERFSVFSQTLLAQLRRNKGSYTLKELLAEILDEDRKTKSDSAALEGLQANYTKKGANSRYSKPWKKEKGQYCKFCEKPTHDTNACYTLFGKDGKSGLYQKVKAKVTDPESSEIKKIHLAKAAKANKAKVRREKAILQAIADRAKVVELPDCAEEASETTEATPLSSESTEMDLDDEEFDIFGSDAEVFNAITYYNDYKVNNLSSKLPKVLGKLEKTRQIYHSRIDGSYWILDTAAEAHIVCNKAFFTTFSSSKIKNVSWGTAKTVQIQGIGTLILKFTDSKNQIILKDCLYMPDMGTNLISQSKI